MWGSTRRLRRVAVTGTALLLLAAAGSAAPTRPRLAAPPCDADLRALLPPPADPVDGHRHAHRSGAVLRFDARLGVYTVSGVHDVYFFASGFVRHRDGGWEFSDRPAGPWLPGRAEWVPLSLRVALYR